MFNSNMFFASVNLMDFKQPGRCDDLISLVYMLVYMSNGGQLPGIDLETR